MKNTQIYFGIFGTLAAIGAAWWAYNKWGKKDDTITPPAEEVKPAASVSTTKKIVDVFIPPAETSVVGKNVYAKYNDVKVSANTGLTTVAKTVKKDIWVGVIAEEVSLYGVPYYKLNGNTGSFLGYVLKANVYIK